MLIYIRHADDNKTATHRHDGSLSMNGIEDASVYGKKLIQEYGVPDCIIMSPYRRTVQTAYTLIDDHDVEMYYDNDISKYISRRIVKSSSASINKETNSYDPPKGETGQEVRNRTNRHCRSMKKEWRGKIVWIVTHAIVFKYARDYYGKKGKSHINFLDTFTVRNRIRKSRRY